MAQRTLSTDVKIEKSGDVGAIRETAADVRDLKSAGDDASTGLDKASSSAKSLDGSLRSTGGHAGDAADKLRKMDTASASAAGGLSKFGSVLKGIGKAIGAAGLAVKVFQESFEQTRSVVNFFEREFGISIDNIVRNSLKLDSVAEKFVGLGNRVADSAELLKNQENIFNNLNIDGFSDNVEKNADLIAEHMKAIQKGQDEAAEAVQRGQDFLSKLGLNYDELVSDAQQFTDDLSQALKLSDLDVEDVAEDIEDEVRKMVAAFEKLGKDVPPELAILEGQLDELASKTEGAGDRIGKGADKAKTGFEKLVESSKGLNGIDIEKFLKDFSHLSEVDLTRMIEGLTGLSQTDFTPAAEGIKNIRNALDGLEPTAVRVYRTMQRIGNPDAPSYSDDFSSGMMPAEGGGIL